MRAPSSTGLSPPTPCAPSPGLPPERHEYGFGSYTPARPFRRSDAPLLLKGTTFVTMLDAAMPENTVETVEAPAGPSEFELLGLPKALITGLLRSGISSPFPIQTATIPDVLAGHDVLGRGQTGSGKPLAFG